MKFLTFMQMCENRKEMDFSVIQEEMQMDKDQVEEFVIDGQLVILLLCVAGELYVQACYS